MFSGIDPSQRSAVDDLVEQVNAGIKAIDSGK
jgi:hypothetical protein